MARDLAHLRDNLPAFPTDQARMIVERALGQPVSTLFSTFEEMPVAAASIAQVHFATRHDGSKVAVKIVRPGIEKAFERDISLFYWLAEQAERRLPSTRRMQPREMIRTLTESVAYELDLRYEAAAAVELKENTKDDDGFYVPEIHWSLTAKEVLTMERIEGIAVHEIDQLREEGYDFDRIATHAATIFFKQVFRDGFFHADPHPGNVFVLPDNRIAVVDFGIMGRLGMKDRIFLAEVLRGFLLEDYAAVARVHMEAGIVPAHKSPEHFALACRAIARPIIDKPLHEISVARLLGQLFSVAETFEMRLQPQFLLLQKTMMLTEGFGRRFKPDMNIWKLAEPMIITWAEEHLGARAQLRMAAQETANRLKRLPDLLEKTEAAMSRLAEPTASHASESTGWRTIGVTSVITAAMMALLLTWLGSV